MLIARAKSLAKPTPISLDTCERMIEQEVKLRKYEFRALFEVSISFNPIPEQ